MKRHPIIVRPGWDCTRHPCGRGNCGKTAGGNHGVHNDEYIYVVSDGAIALALSVGSNIYPFSVPDHVPQRYMREEPPRGMRAYDLAMHVGFIYERDHLRFTTVGEACEFVDGGRCFGGSDFSTSLGAGEFFEKHHDKTQKEQGKAFWLALEDELCARFKAAGLKRVEEEYARCPSCDGIGTVRHNIRGG